MRRQSKAFRAARIILPWTARVMSPWALGVGVLVSFTAVAGQHSASDWNIAPLSARMGDRSAHDTIPSFAEAATGDFGDYGQTRALVQQARLAVGAPEDIRSIPDEREPHVDLKREAKNFPEVDRTRKGDPVVSIRPSIETRASSLTKLGLIQPAHLSFAIGDGGVEGGSFDGGRALLLAPRAALLDDARAEPEAAFQEPPTTQKSTAAASPAQTASAATTPASAASPPVETARAVVAEVKANASDAQAVMEERALHGATLLVARAVALSSTTPAQPDATPIEVSSFKGATLALATPRDKNARPDYAALVDHGKLDIEKRCLAEAVYFEARSEPEAGQAAVAQVVLNRVSSGLYPSSVCGVVYQNRHHYHGCQFSFACEGKSLRITERESWEQAVRVADEVMDGRTYISDVGRSTHYHANYVRPRWARALTKMDVIGHHIFYRLKPGQT